MNRGIELNNTEADIWMPEGVSFEDAVSRTTCLAIGAHQDDLEIMAYEGIARCYKSTEEWFTGVVVTDGRGSSRLGPYADLNDDEMRLKRREEQREAAVLGQYGLQMQLDYESQKVKGDGKVQLVEDLVQLLLRMRPEVVYLHQPADKHATHVAVMMCCLEALRQVAGEYVPERVLGCEVWRDLDWLGDSEKVAMDCSAYPELARSLVEVFDSQISGGKAYDEGALGRRRANATFCNSHSSDDCEAVSWAMDLRPLVVDQSLGVAAFVGGKIDGFKGEVLRCVDESCL